MKKRKLFIVPLAMLFGVSLSACGSGKEIKISDKSVPILTENPDDLKQEWEFNYIKCDTSNMKTKYYLGEELDLTGLKVYAKLIRTGSIEENEIELTDYSIDTSNVDNTVISTPLITVKSRIGKEVRSSSFRVTYTASKLEDSGVDYVAGLECNKSLINVTLNSTWTDPIIKVVAHKFNGNTEIGTESIKKIYYEITGDVDTSHVGDYVRKITYKTSVVIDGETYEYEVSTFYVVHVKNDITKIELESGNLEIPVSTKGLDLSSWKIKVTTEIGQIYVEEYSKEKYTVTNVNPIVEGTYMAHVVNNESGQAFDVSVKIIPSTTQDILICTDLWNHKEETNADGITYLEEKHYLYTTSGASFAQRFDGTGDEISYKDSYGALNFTNRITIKGTTKFCVDMRKAGTIVLYAANSGADAREVNISSEEELLKTFKLGEKQQILEYVIDVDKAGLYTVEIPLSGYIHGCILAFNK